MPKRKAKELGEVEQPRRSSRRISTTKEEKSPSPDTATKKAASKALSSQLKQRRKAANESAETNGDHDAEGGESVSTVITYYLVRCILLSHDTVLPL